MSWNPIDWVKDGVKAVGQAAKWTYNNVYEPLARVGTGVVGELGIPIVSPIASSAHDYLEQKHKEDRQDELREEDRAYQTGERESAQQWSEYMWNQQNAYNNPAAQMQRMTEAGINPNNAAAAISGGNTATGAPSSSGMSAPSPMPTDLLQYNSALNAAETMANLPLIRQRVRESEANEALTRASAGKVKHEIDQIISNIGLQGAQAEQIRQLTPLLVDKTWAECEQIYQSARLLAEQVTTERKKQQNVDANTALQNAQRGQVEAQTEGISYDNEVKSLVADLAKKGIYVSNSDMGTLVALLASGRADNIVSQLFTNIKKMLFGSDEPEDSSPIDKIGEAVGSDGKVEVIYGNGERRRVSPEQARRAQSWSRVGRGMIHNIVPGPRKGN